MLPSRTPNHSRPSALTGSVPSTHSVRCAAHARSTWLAVAAITATAASKLRMPSARFAATCGGRQSLSAARSRRAARGVTLPPAGGMLGIGC